MKSPFAIFRKHQKVLMVVLTGLAMFAFVVLDSLTRNMAAATPVMGFMLGALIVGLLARKWEHAWAWAVLGGAAGILLGTQIQSAATASTTVVSTSFGSFNDEDLNDVTRRQQIVNSFLTEAFRSAYEGEENPPYFQLQQYMFGGQNDPRQEAVTHLLLMKEADKLKLGVSPEQISAYIDEATANRLSKRAFNSIANRMRLSGRELYDLLGEQMIARQTQAVLMPELLPSPESYWNAYQKLNVRQELAVVPIATESFLPLVDKPADAELKALFEEFKDKYPGQTDAGSPGFRQPGRIQVGYLEIDYDTVEKTIPEITAEEIEAYYEANKNDFRNNVTPTFPGDLPEGTSPAEEQPASGPALMLPGAETEKPAEETPKTEEKPAETPAAPAPEAGKTDAAEKPAESAQPAEAPAKPAEPAPAAETPATETPAAENKEEATPEPAAPAGESQSRRLMQPFGNALASIQDDQPEAAPAEQPAETPAAPAAETPAGETKPEAPAEPASPAPTESPAAPAEKPADPPAGEKPAEEKPATETPAETPAEQPVATPEPAAPLPEFKPLDDTLREQIRRQLLDQKTRAQMAQISTEAIGYMININAKFATATEKTQAAVIKEIREEAEKFAKEKGLRYVETPFLSPEELEASEDHPIGRSTDPVANPFERAGARNFIEQHFGVADYEALSRQRFRPMESEDPSTLNRFVHWQIDFKKPHIPTWEEEGVQAQVLETWQKQQARKLALARAEEVVKILQQSDQPWVDALSGVTETGKEDSQNLGVTYTGEFSWVSRSSAPQTNPFAPPPMEVTQIPIIFGGVDNEFMEQVFQNLQNGEIGTVVGADRRYVFVVRVDNRTDLAQVRTDFIGPQSNLFSFFSPYAMLTNSDRQEIVNTWARKLYEDYKVQWKEDPEE